MTDIKQLKYALTLAATGNYARAANELHISQPGLSRSIMKLEENLGIKLFVRSQNQTVPTPEGERILKQAHKVIFELKKLEAQVDEEKGILTGELIVGVGTYPEEFFLADILAEVARRLPNIHIKSITCSSIEFIARLYGKTLDFFIGEKSLVEKDRSLKSKALKTVDRGYFFCRADHQLLTISELQLEDICRYPFVGIHLPDRVASNLPISKSFGDFEGSLLRPRICCYSHHIQKKVVAASDCVGICSKSSIEEEIKKGVLAILPIETGMITDYGICYLKNRKLSKLDKAFIDIVREVDKNRHEAAG